MIEVFILFLNDAIISLQTPKQHCIAFSTMETEYVSSAEAAKELIRIINIIKEGTELKMFLSNSLEFKLYCGNRAVIDFFF